MKAAFQRKLRSGSQYEKFFPTANLKHQDYIAVEDGDTFDTVDLMAKLAREYQGDTAGLAQTLKGKDLQETCRKIWEFAYGHFQYKEDKAGVEQLRRPLRAWEERVTGIDCDCFSLLVSTILLNLGIEHSLRKTKYNGGSEYQHIYVVVPTGRGGHYTIDPVTDEFNKEVPFSAHFDKPMKVQVLNGLPIQVLNGAPSDLAKRLVPKGNYQAFGFGAEFVGLAAETAQAQQDALRTVAMNGLGALAASDLQATPEQIADLANATGQTHEEAAADLLAVQHLSESTIERLRQYLFNTSEQIDSYPKKDPELVILRNRINLILKNWDNVAERNRLFEELGEAEDREYQEGLRSAGLQGPGLGGFFSAIGDAFSSVGSAIGSAASWVGSGIASGASAVGSGVANAAGWVGTGIKNGAVAVGTGVANAANWTYGTVIKPVGQAIAQAASWTAEKVKQAVVAAAQGIKKAAVWIADEAVKLGKLILKYNPLSILIRAGLRVAFRVNLFYMSGRLGHGYFSEAQAQAFGMDMDEWRKCKSQLGKVISLWEGLQGDVDILQESILIGYQSGKQPRIADKPDQGLSGYALRGLAGLGEPATAATTAAASGFIATIVQWLKNVDWEKLLKVAKTVIDKIGLTKSYAAVPAINDNTMLPTSEQDYLANQQKYETQQTPAGSDLMLPVAIGAAALGLILLNNGKSK